MPNPEQITRPITGSIAGPIAGSIAGPGTPSGSPAGARPPQGARRWPAVRVIAWSAAAVGVLLGGLSHGCTAGKSQRLPLSYELSRWDYGDAEGRKLVTTHYEIYTTVKDEVLLASLPGLVEDAFQHYQTLVPPQREVSTRMKVFLFLSRGQWADFTQRFTGPRARIFLQIRNGGYSERGISVIQYVAHQTTFPILVHEGFHQYLHHYVNPAVPAWLNEGLATLCEGQRWATLSLKSLDLRPEQPITTQPASRSAYTGIVQFDPWYNPSRRNDLAEAVLSDQLYELTELLDTHAGRIVQGSTRAVMTYYAQVWALMLFLEHGAGGKYAAGFSRLRQSLGADEIERRARAEFIGSDAREYNLGELLFRAYITNDLETAQTEYREFLTRVVLGRGRA